MAASQWRERVQPIGSQLGTAPGGGWQIVPRPCGLGALKYRRDRANDVERLWFEKGPLRGLGETVMMDSKADD